MSYCCPTGSTVTLMYQNCLVTMPIITFSTFYLLSFLTHFYYMRIWKTLQRNRFLSLSWSKNDLPENLTNSSIYLNSGISFNIGENILCIQQMLRGHGHSSYVLDFLKILCSILQYKCRFTCGRSNGIKF